MRVYDNEILKANIEKLRKGKGLSQAEFAEIAGVQQSRISKLLGNDDGGRFSIEQVYNIASAFRVSIDYLVTGNEPQPISSARQVCEVLVHLFDDYFLEHSDFSRVEEIERPIYYYENGYQVPDSETNKRTIKYDALYFPHCWYPDPGREYTEDEMMELQSEASQIGNELSRNIAINKFLSAYIPIHELHSAAKMPDEAYHYTVQSLLDSVK